MVLICCRLQKVGKNLYIEVKATAGDLVEPFYLSNNELKKAEELKDKGCLLYTSEKWLEQVVKNPFVQDMTVLYDEVCTPRSLKMLSMSSLVASSRTGSGPVEGTPVSTYLSLIHI